MINDKHISRFVLFAILVLAAMLAMSVLLPFVNRLMHPNDDIRRLHQLGLALLLYENNHSGSLPNKLDDLVTCGLIKPDVLRSHALSNTDNTQDMYFAAGKNIKDLDALDAVVVDTISTHHVGANVLLSDGISVYVDANESKYVLQHGRMQSLTVNGKRLLPTSQVSPSTAN